MNADKPPSAWTEADILALIDNAVEEGPTLEYKACGSLQKTDSHRKEVSKDVSAFANSGGGTIVYGIIEKNHVPERVDTGFDPNDITKEWLEHVINGTIQPRINGLHINSVHLDATSPQRVAYVVSVPQGLTAHQASDKRYYKRFNFESVPMEDYEIRDVMNRLKHPLLVPEISYEDLSISSDYHEYKLKLALKNKGSMRAIDIKLVLRFPQVLIKKYGKGYEARSDLRREATAPRSSYEEIELVVKKTSFVIFPDDEWRVTEERNYILVYEMNQQRFQFLRSSSPYLVWKVFADDMPPQSGEISIDKLQKF